jgi:hypothetical protein
VKAEDKVEIEGLFAQFLEKHFGEIHEEKDKVIAEEVKKAIDLDEHLFTAVVLVPDQVDAHGDVYSSDVVEKACHDYNTLCRKANLQHLVEIDKAYPVESYIAPADFTLGEGGVKKGSWVMTMKIEDPEIWKACKDGDLTGFSVGCIGQVEDI